MNKKFTVRGMPAEAGIPRFFFAAILLAGLLFSLPAASKAQSGIVVYNMSNSGMPDNSVHCITVDPAGNKWVGTDWGLVKFDGSNWLSYNTGNSGIGGNSVRAIAVDDTGAVWVGTLSGGLSRFDGANWTVWNTMNSPLPADQIRDIGIDPGGGVWAGGIGGLVKLKDTTWTVFDFMAHGHESNHVAAISVSAPDTLWVGIINGGLLRLEDTTKTFYTIANSGLEDNSILSIVEDSGEDLWMAAPSAAAIRLYNLLFSNMNSTTSDNPSASMLDVCLDASEQPWFASIDTGVVTFDGTTWRNWDVYNSDVPQNYVRAVAYDASTGLIWGGTMSEGLFSLDPVMVASQEMHSVAGIEIFPNPASERVTISGLWPGRLSLSICDLQGRIVKAYEVRGGREASLDLRELNAGTYFLRINAGSSAETRKLIVRH